MSALPPPLPGLDPERLVGTTLDGRYRLDAHLATGGMGAVFRAQHVYMRKDVAIKVLRPDLTASMEIVERFRREAEIAASLEHENIVRVTDFGRSAEGYLFLAMELLDGESLFDRIRRDGALRAEDAVPVLVQVCAALDAAHARGVVHRDLKPENVFLARTADGREVTKILDFGIAKIADPASVATTQAGMVVGTPEYLAPEQALGTAVDGRADVYAVGVMAWRTLAGRHPFQSAEDARALLMMQATRPVPPLTEPRPDLAAYPALVAAVARACEKDARDRHPTAGALGAALADALGPAYVPPASPAPPGGPRTPAPRTSSTWTPLVEPAGAPELLPTPLVAPPDPALARRLRAARLVERARTLARRAAASLRRPRVAIAAAAAALILGALGLAAARSGGRTAAEARALLDAGRPAEARAALEAALASDPDDLELRLLLGRALHRLPDGHDAGIDAYAAALERGALDELALVDLTSDLARGRVLAERASRLLVRAGAPAHAAVLEAATASGSGLRRLRALRLARDLGIEERLADRTGAWAALLAEPDCDVRRAASGRLAELGDPAVLPRLRTLAGARREKRGGFLGLGGGTEAACGAAEAAEAARRIEAAIRAAKSRTAPASYSGKRP